jgi:endonuclease/exonuclease/phosphatase (EEP) superfamily protein YafD
LVTAALTARVYELEPLASSRRRQAPHRRLQLTSFWQRLGVLFDFAVVLVAAFAGSAALAAQGGRWNHRLDLITHVTPVLLAGGLICLLLGLFARSVWRRWTTLGFSLIAVTSASVLMWSDLARLPEAFRPLPAGKTLKIIEFNAWMKNADPAASARWIGQENPDVVVIIEPTPALEHEITTQTPFILYHEDEVTIAVRPGPWVFHVGWEVHDFPGAWTEMAWLDIPGQDGRSFTIAGVHCVWPIPDRGAVGQDLRLASFLAAHDHRNMILAGDFNSTQWSFRQKIADAAFGLERRDIATPTWPARVPRGSAPAFPFPFLSIDHIYAGSAWKAARVVRGPRLGSDHYPLVATLVWNDS